MKRLLAALACITGVLLPSAASAALSLNIMGQVSGTPGAPEIDAMPFGGTQAFELVFAADVASDADDEGLFAYDLLLVVPERARGSFALQGAEQPDNFVLDVPGGATFSVAESTPHSLLINVASNNNLANIRNGMKAARVFFHITDPTLGVVIPVTALAFDPNATVFGSGDPNRPLVIPVDLSDTGIVAIVPEPAGLSVVGLAGLLALRRRPRRAA